jgi:hypothetical protein
LIAIIVGLGVTYPASAQLVSGLVDDFETSLAGWASGDNNPTPAARVVDAGLLGLGDDVMRLSSSGVAGPGHGLVVMNSAQWAGNYFSAGVTSISFDVRNLGATDLDLRLAFNSADTSTWFVTAPAFMVPSGSGWQHTQLSLAEADLARVAGSQTYGEVFGSVSEVRLLHSPGLGYKGEAVAATLYVDNITAIPEPAASAAALGVSAVVVAAWLRRRKALSQPRTAV